jgi:diguanylate cyclase (GGDEF)-like protein
MELALIYDALGGGTATVAIDLRAGGADPAARISEPLARAAMASPDGLAVDDPAAPELNRADDPTSLAAFIGAPIDVGSECFGALCFASSVRRDARFAPADRDLVQLISVLVGAEIERRRARLHLRTLAYYDSLTNLPNRVLLKERLEAALATGAQNGAKTAVLFLDLDRFKDINDTIGHVLGDRLLQVAGERIVGCVRASETVARMGGDEFIVVMPAIQETGEAVALAERLLKAIDAPFSIAGHERYTTTSIGIAVAPSDGSDSDTLIKNADIAMYRAKDRGRNTFALFTPEFDRTTSLRVANEQGMRRALDRGEFRTFYQPIVDVRGGKVYCVEALARWQHPALSVLRPDAFISSAETSGLIVRLGEIVLDDACRQVRAWHGAGFSGLMLSVNLSARQFRETQLIETLATILGRTGFPPHLLQIEITEGVAMTDPEMNVGIMRELKEMGVRMILDDFGTGYSSLAYLRRFPLDGLKIDRSFVAGVGHERDDETIARTVIGMAHSLGLFVVAEGVETADQVEFLRRENCEMAQGHFYSPALPAAGCERYLRAWADLVNAG